MNPDSVDKNDLKDVQLQDEDIMYDIASSVETIISTWDFVEKMNYGLKLKQVMAHNCRIPKNLLDRVPQLHWPFSLPEHLKAENMDLTSHLPQSLFDVGSERISIVIVNT
ncbi:hypothetical protein Tco_0603084 [Tanacetum coccineum]